MELTYHRDFSTIAKEEWNGLLDKSITHVPFLRYEYLNVWWQTRGGGEWPLDAQLAIITAREGERLVGVAPLFAATWDGKPSLLLLGSIEISDYLDLIVAAENVDAFALELLRFLKDGANGLPAWERLDLYNVLETSPSLPALRSAAEAAGADYHHEPFRPSLTITLPGNWDTYLASIDKKQRHEIRRKMRRAYSGEKPVHWFIAKDPDAIDGQIEDFLHLMELDPDKASFLTPPMRENFRRTVRCAFDEDCLLLAFLEVDGHKAAAYLSFDYLDQLWVYNSGMDFHYTEYSPGWVLLGELLKWANENSRKAFDFMRGDEDYKFRFGAKKRDVMRVSLTKK
jgi:CelD/BcsL family acetyltransferase involved in cellulose biosynthesis